MSIEEKTERVKSFLQENGIKYRENYFSKRCDTVIPLLIRSLKIAVHPGDDQDFYRRVNRVYRPVFIREEDTGDFVLEKVQNIIIKIMTGIQQKQTRKNERGKK